MPKKHRNMIAIITVLTFIHMVFCAMYQWIYAYFNTNNQLSTLLLVLWIFRIIFYVGVALAGYVAIKDGERKTVPLYLLLFFFNLVIPYIFK